MDFIVIDGDALIGVGLIEQHIEMHIFHYPTHAAMFVFGFLNLPNNGHPDFESTADGGVMIRGFRYFATSKKANEFADRARETQKPDRPVEVYHY